MARKSYTNKHSKQPANHRSTLIVIGLLAAGLILGGILLLTQDRTTAAPAGPARVGAALRNFTLTDLSGKQVQLSDYADVPCSSTPGPPGVRRAGRKCLTCTTSISLTRPKGSRSWR